MSRGLNLLRVSITFTVISLLTQCTKSEPFNPKVVDCNDDLFCSTIRLYNSDGVEFQSPFLLNDSTIICRRIAINPITPSELVSIDINTLKTEVLISPFYVLDYDYNFDNLLVCTGTDWKIYTINLDDKRIKQISNGRRDILPRFNKGGDLICYSAVIDFNPDPLEDSIVGSIVISDLEGNQLTNFCLSFNNKCTVWSKFEWYHKDEFISERGREETYGISVFDSTGNEIRELVTFYMGANTNILDIERHPNEKLVYYVNSEGIHEFNLENNSNVLIAESCNHDSYRDLSISETGEYLVALKSEFIPVQNCFGILNSKIIRISTKDYSEELIIEGS